MTPDDGRGRRDGARRRGRRARKRDATADRSAPTVDPDEATDDAPVPTASTAPSDGDPGDGASTEPSTVGPPATDAATGPDAVDPSRAAFQVLVDANPLGALVIDGDGRVVLHNERASHLLGTHHHDLAHGRFGYLVTAEPQLVTRRDLDGVARAQEHVSVPFDGLDEPAWLVTIRDTSTPATAPDLEDHFGSSTHDPLTGLPGRELLLNHVFEQARRSRSLDDDRFAVVVIDLERFGRINDEHGREAGDRVLQAVATRLTSAVRPSDYVSRLGDDEFAVVLPAQPTSAHRGVTDRLAEVLVRPVLVDGVEITCVPVLGLAEHVDGDDEEVLVDRATDAMVAGSPGVTTIAERPTTATARVGRPGAAPVHEVPEDEVFVHYQPIVALDGGGLAGLEALARWEHPDDGLVAPDETLRIEEEGGTTTPIGEWVVTEVCAQLAAWRDEHPDYLVPSVAVGLGPRQLSSPAIRTRLLAELARHELDPAGLLVEITEDVLLDRDPRVEALLREIAADGLGLALDRFGTGLSSLSHLHRFPLALIKLDPAFVTRLMTDEPSAHLVLATIEAAHAFGVPVTAVGVTTADQQGVLERWGCDFLQGPLIGRPLTPFEAPRLFDRDPASVRARPEGPLLRSSGTFDRPLLT